MNSNYRCDNDYAMPDACETAYPHDSCKQDAAPRQNPIELGPHVGWVKLEIAPNIPTRNKTNHKHRETRHEQRLETYHKDDLKEDLKHLLPDRHISEVIVPGLIDTTTARVEDPRGIAEYLLRYVRAAGHPGRVMASTDCGFASTARSTAITADLVSWLRSPAWRSTQLLFSLTLIKED